MANGVQRKRRPAQKGVEAVFTPDRDESGKAQYIFGLVAIGIGATLWMLEIQASWGSTGDAVQMGIVSSPLMLVSMAMSLVIGGVGLCTYSLAVRRTRQDNKQMESAIYELEALVASRNGVPDPTPAERPDEKLPERQASSQRISKSLAVALVEAVMLIIVYGGLVQEYVSNINMQHWVQANIAFAGYVLNYNAVLLLTTALSGVLVYQLLPTERRSS